MTLVCVVMVPMLCPDWAMPGMLGVVLLSRAAAYPARRALLGETWSLWSYLDWSVRLFIALAGFWALLAWTPYLVNLAGRFWLLATGLLATTLIAWQRWFPQILLRTLRATPLDPGSIGPAFADSVTRVMQASHAGAPTLWHAGPTGGVVANALALPSLSRSSVLFSDTLLESLSPAEATAIFAHEVAHLEHYDRARLRRITATTLALIAGAVVSVPLTAWLAPRRLWIPIAAWPIAVIVAMAIRGRHSQANESASDRRAIELCGEPEALALALVKLHTLARIPRRWSPELEQRASHPSLARRLRDIRGRSSGSADLPAAPVIVQGADDRTWVVIEGDRIRHLSGVPAGTSLEVPALVAAAATAVSLPYEQVTDLRVVVAKNAACSLQIVTRMGGAFRLALRDTDIQRVQAALDNVDPKIASHASAGGDQLTRILAPLCALAVILVGLVGHSLSLMVVAVASLIQMSPAALAGLGAASVAAAAMLLLTRTVGSSSLAIIAAIVMGAVLLWRAWYWRRHLSIPVEPRWRPLLLAVGVLCAWIAVILPSTNLLMLHRLVSEMPATAILPAALAATLSTAAPRRRRSGAIMSVLAAAPLLIAAPQFADRFVGDPFLVRSAPFGARQIALLPIASTPAPPNASSLRLSRNGSRFLVAIDEDAESEDTSETGRFILGDFEGHRREIAAVDAAFIDDHRLLVVSRSGSRTQVALDSGDQGEQPPSWQESFDMPGADQIDVDSMSGRWRITSRSADRLFRVQGTVGSVTGRREWQIAGELKQHQWLAGNGDDALGWGLEFQYHPINWWPLLYGAGITHIPFWPARFDVLDGNNARPLGRTFQETICQAGPPGSAVLCFLSDGRTTRIWRFDGQRFDLAGTVAGKMTVNSRRSATQTIAWIDGRDALVDIARHEVLWLDPPLGACCGAYGWDAVPGMVGALVNSGETDKVMTWSVTGLQ